MMGVEELKEENAFLKQRIAELTGENDRITVQRAFGLSPKQAGVLALLLRNKRVVTRQALYSEVFEHDNGDGPFTQIMAVVVSKVRVRLREFKAPGTIQTVYGSGYCLTDDLRAWLDARLAVAS